MDGLHVEDLLNLTNAGELQANDQTAVFVTAQPNADDQSKYRWQVYRQTATEKPVVLLTTDSHPGLALASHSLYCSTVDSKHNLTRLRLVDLASGATTQSAVLTDHQLTVTHQLTNGKLLLFGKLHFHESKNEPWHDVNEVPFWSNDEGQVDSTRHHLWTYDPQTQQLQDLLPKDFDCSDYWYQDGRLFLTGVSYQASRPFQDGLYEYQFNNQQLFELVPPEQYRVDTVALLDQQLYVLAADGQEYGMGQNPNFYQVGANGLTLVQELDQNLGNIVVSDQMVVGGNTDLVHHNVLYFYSTVVDHNEFYRFDGKRVTRVFSYPGALNSFAFRGDDLLLTASNQDGPQQLYRWHDHDFEQQTTFNAFLDQRHVAHLHQVDYQDSTGRDAHGWVLFPTNYEEGHRYPGVLEVHGGPRGTYGLNFFHEMQVLANNGYFVFLTNVHGSEGQGDEYADLRGRYGTVDYDDLMAFTDAVCQQFQAVDPDRLGVTGGSYGGFMTNWVVGHTHRFKAAVSERSIATWSSMMISDIGPEFVTDQMANSLDHPQGMDHFWKHSPLRYASNVETPTLFLHSDHDFRCPIPEGYQMFQALKLRGVTTHMVVFHGANHDLSRNGRPDQRMKRVSEVVNWFNQYLK